MINIENTCKFLAYYLNVDYDILLKSMQEKRKKKQHYHYSLKNDDGIIIEISCNDKPEELDENIIYAHNLLLEKNKDNNPQYSQVIQLNMNNFNFENNDRIVDVYTFKNDDILLDNQLILILIFIPNLRKKYETEGIESLSEAERFLLVLIEEDIEKAKKIAKGNPIMEEYIKDVIKINKNTV